MGSINRREVPPFMVKLFYRTGAFHRPDEFNADQLPPHLTLHTWSDCTLTELSHHLADASSSPHPSHGRSGGRRSSNSNQALLPDPAIGTRLAFRLIFQDTRSSAHGAKYMIKDLGSIVIGGGGADDDDDERGQQQHSNGHRPTPNGRGAADYEENDEDEDGEGEEAQQTLATARFVVGDYLSCAILPPLPDGSVAPASSARMGRGSGAGEARAQVGRFAPGSAGASGAGGNSVNSGGYGGFGSGGGSGGAARENGHYHPYERGGPPRSQRGRWGGLGAGEGGRGGAGGGMMPPGEWRRGEQVPDVPRGEWRRGEALPDAQPPSFARRRGGRGGRY